MGGVQKSTVSGNIDEVDALQQQSFDQRGAAVFRDSPGCNTSRPWQNGIFHYHAHDSFHSSEHGRYPSRYYVGAAPTSESLICGTVAPVQRLFDRRPFQLVTNIRPDDVLSGRGGATNSHSGNRSFRTLVKRYQDQYLHAKKREKPAVASTIVDQVRQTGGRFLRRIDTTPSGELLWIDIGDERAKEKTCQALREGAPGIRKKRKTYSRDEAGTKSSSADPEVTFSSSSSLGRTASSIGEQSIASVLKYGTERERIITVPDSYAARVYQDGNPKDEPIMIRPSAELTRLSFSEAISVDQLEPHDRELYLRDFLPPNPAIQQGRANNRGSAQSAKFCDDTAEKQATNPWPVVQV